MKAPRSTILLLLALLVSALTADAACPSGE